MATHSSFLALRILWTEELGGLMSIGLHRVGHDWSNLACMHALEKEMATHSSILAWRISGTEEPDGLPSMGSHRVGHDWSNLAAAAAAYSVQYWVFKIASDKRCPQPGHGDKPTRVRISIKHAAAALAVHQINNLKNPYLSVGMWTWIC